VYKPRLKSIINRSLNYGREKIDAFLSGINKNKSAKVLDIGAEHADDLLTVKQYNPYSELNGIEIYEPYAE